VGRWGGGNRKRTEEIADTFSKEKHKGRIKKNSRKGKVTETVKMRGTEKTTLERDRNGKRLQREKKKKIKGSTGGSKPLNSVRRGGGKKCMIVMQLKKVIKNLLTK